eukprot:112433_1
MLEHQTNSIEHKQDNVYDCNGEYGHCYYLKTLIKYIKQYNNTGKLCNNIESNLECFLHSLSKHNSIPDFEWIHDQLPRCNITNCNINSRYHSEKNIQYECDYLEDFVTQQVMDKIHIYYYHSYHFGHKLTKTERRRIDRQLFNSDEQKYSNELHIINKGKMLLNKLLSPKHKRYQKIRNIKENNKFVSKFGESNHFNNTTKLTEVKPAYTVYSFGYPFEYKKKANYQGRQVQKKHSSFKIEITQNSPIKLTIGQYNNELRKAKLYHSQLYRRQNVPNIKQHHILAVMIHCNFDSLSYQFNLTFRENSSIDTICDVNTRHSKFYWLGLHLEEATMKYGTQIQNSNVTKFYHGIHGEMIFPHLFSRHGHGVNIYSPLSTSSVYEVAVNFTMNEGLIVEFGDGRKGDYSDYYFPVNCFSCCWLSDYVHEFEYLFTHLKYGGLRFINITHTTNGMEFCSILKALETIDYITSCTKRKHNNLELVDMVLKHQLSFSISCSRINSLHEYAQQLLNTYFNNKIEIEVDSIQQRRHEWLDFQYFNVLFPNLKVISIKYEELRLLHSMHNLRSIVNYFFNNMHITELHVKHSTESRKLLSFEEFNRYYDYIYRPLPVSLPVSLPQPTKDATLKINETKIDYDLYYYPHRDPKCATCFSALFHGFLLICMLLALMGWLFGWDIYTLSISTRINCNDTISNRFTYIPGLDVDVWMKTGSISHLCVVTISCICWWLLKHLNGVAGRKVLFHCLLCGAVLFHCLFIPWSVIGLLLHSQMNASANSGELKQCDEAVVVWSILRFIELWCIELKCLALLTSKCYKQE